MGSPTLNASREAAVWARLMRAQTTRLSPEAAEYLLSNKLAESDRNRMERLAERSEAGILTDEERAEFEGYLHVGIFSPSCNPKQGLFSGENHGIRAFRECQRSSAGLAARNASM